MKKILFIGGVYFFVIFNVIEAQTLTFISELNAPLTYYVDGLKINGSSIQVTVGKHSVQAKYSNGLTAISDNIDVPKGGFSYTITPPPVNILVKRKEKRDNCTLGEMYVNGAYFCKTLELLFKNDENNISSIAVGTYNAHIGSTDNFPNGVIILDNVKSNVYYKDANGEWKTKIVDRNIGGYIEIHSGNVPEESKGCIIVGNDYSAEDCHIQGGSVVIPKLNSGYLDPDAQSKLNFKIKVTVTIEIDYKQ